MSDVPIGDQSILTVATPNLGSSLFGRPMVVSVPLRVLGRSGEISVPADGEEHVVRCDGDRLYLDGEPVRLREAGS